MLPRKNGKIYATRTLTNCLRFNKRLDMNFLVRKVQEVDILNPLCVSIVEIFESRAMNAFSFFRVFGLLVNRGEEVSLLKKKAAGQQRSPPAEIFLTLPSSRNTQQKRPNTTQNARAFSVAANNNSTGGLSVVR